MKKTKIIFILLFVSIVTVTNSQNVIVIIIDGARYSETFGDPERTYIPNMAELAVNGAVCDEFYNDHITYTSQAVPALWAGSWSGSRDTVYQGNSTQYTIDPSIFEYLRKQKDLPADQVYHTLKYVNSLWLQSFHEDYGPDYWPETISSGSSDNDVLATTLNVMQNDHPQFLWMYLADVDSKGHSGIWDDYTDAIENADNIVNIIWETIQTDIFYKDNTYLLVTNDHGRHDDQHGGFSGHGCSCVGCRHIMFLALGPNIKQNYISSEHHEIEDFSVTASHILNITAEFSTGSVIEEIFKNSEVSYSERDFFMYVENNNLHFSIDKSSLVLIEIFNILGQKVKTVQNSNMNEGKHIIKLKELQRGIYILRLQEGNTFRSLKFFVE